jgi:hypothetical protein
MQSAVALFELGTTSYRADLRCGLQLLSISWAASLLLSVKHTTACGRSATTRQSRVSEVDLMSAIYLLSVHRRIERQWAERVKSLKTIPGQIVLAAVPKPSRRLASGAVNFSYFLC